MIRRSPLKRGTPKKRTGHDKAMLTAVKGELCYLRIPSICIGGLATVVPCHSNQNRHGKGMGLKARDEFTVPGCMACHFAIDQSKQFSKQEKFAFWDSAFEAWEPVREMKLTAKNNPATALTVLGLQSQSL